MISTGKTGSPSYSNCRVNYEGVLGAVGNTPLVKLSRILENTDIQLFAKLESFNPAGSIKDRPARHIIEKALQSGEISRNTTIIETSSGNFAIGLAQVCAFYGLRFICVLDRRATEMNLSILSAFGVQIEVVEEPDPESGEFLQACVQRVQAIRQTLPDSFWPDQHNNPDNARAHHETMREIVRDLDGQVDYLFCATSTCGTLRGCAEYAREHGLSTHIVAVDALGSLIFSNNQQKRYIPGHGAGKVPGIFAPDLADEHVHVSALQSIAGCRMLLQKEAIFAGGSSGGIISAVLAKAHTLKPGSNCVVVICDRGDRYLDTVYCDRWVAENFAGSPEYNRLFMN